jgi:hypothetical protein
MQAPFAYVLQLAKADFGCLTRPSLGRRFDLHDALTDFQFVPVLAENILHESGYVLCHGYILPFHFVAMLMAAYEIFDSRSLIKRNVKCDPPATRTSISVALRLLTLKNPVSQPRVHRRQSRANLRLRDRRTGRS